MYQYLETVRTSFYIFPIIAFLFTVPYILYQYHKYGSIYFLRVLIVYSFILYLLTAYFMVILPLPTIEHVSKLITARTQLIPFHFIVDFVQDTPLVLTNFSTYKEALLHPSCYVVFYNILLTLPFGAYLHYYFKCSYKKTILLTFLLSLFFELTQLSGLYFIYPRGYRLFDVDDLMINTFGGFIGYYVGVIATRILPTRDKIDAKSYQLGLKVSFLRKLTAFCLDGFLFLFISAILSVFNNSFSFFILYFIIYYFIIPIFTNGATLAYLFLHIKIVSNDNSRFRVVLRQLIFFSEIFFIPYFACRIPVFIMKTLDIGLIAIFMSIYLLVLCIYYLILIILRISRKPLFYERISKTSIISTILKK